jgi:hypothetical protein
MRAILRCWTDTGFSVSPKKGIKKYWATVRPFEGGFLTFCYDTDLFDTVEKAKADCRAFAKWKGKKIRKYYYEDTK